MTKQPSIPRLPRRKAAREFTRLKKAVNAMVFQTDVATGKHLTLCAMEAKGLLP